MTTILDKKNKQEKRNGKQEWYKLEDEDIYRTNKWEDPKYKVFLKYCVFSRIPESLPLLPAAIGCTKNYQPIGVTFY